MSVTPVNKQMNLLEWSLLIGLSVLWGGSFFFNGVAVQDIPVLTIVLGRVSIAALALYLFLRIAGISMPRDASVWRAFFIMGFFNNFVPFTLIVWGQSHLASGYASVINATTPMFAVIAAHFLTDDEAMSGNRIIGIAIGFAGVFALVGPDIMNGLGIGVLAQIAILVASLSYGYASVFGRQFKRMKINPIVTATGQVTASSILLVPFVLFMDRPWELAMPGMGSIGAVIGIAILSTALAYILYFRILETAGATNLSLVTLLIPPSAIILGVMFLDEIFLPQHLLGMALIAAGLLAIDGRIISLFRR